MSREATPKRLASQWQQPKPTVANTGFCPWLGGVSFEGALLDGFGIGFTKRKVYLDSPSDFKNGLGHDPNLSFG